MPEEIETNARRVSEARREHGDAEETYARVVEFGSLMSAGVVLARKADLRCESRLFNAFVSVCGNCDQPSIWRHRNLLFPFARVGEVPNPDLPPDIQTDIEEARSILDRSPRGAAALLRLALQKLCMHLGGKGKDIDADIAGLVKKGLDPLIVDALDAVRVIGNQAVHPGQMDLTDDRETVLQLLKVMNVIADHTISRPKQIDALFKTLPESKRKAIADRNKRAAQGG